MDVYIHQIRKRTFQRDTPSGKLHQSKEDELSIKIDDVLWNSNLLVKVGKTSQGTMRLLKEEIVSQLKTCKSLKDWMVT